MTDKVNEISFEEFASNLARIFEHVVHEHAAVIVENKEGERIVVQPVDSPADERIITDEQYKAFRSAAGGWADIDTDHLKEMIYESRKINSRPRPAL
jgi:hypothetical protein